MKKTYRKPKVKQVKLIAEEAVLTGCKTSSHKNTRTCTNSGCAPGASSSNQSS